MKKTSKKVLFFGNERLATGVDTDTPVLKALISAGYEIVAVVSNYEVGNSRKPRPLEIKEVTDEHNIPLLLPDRLADIESELRSYEAEIGVLVAFGKIIPGGIIDIFPKGILNVHPSLLPLHRGPTPIESVILAGAKKTGVSIMSLAKEMDAGPIYGQSEIELTGSETKQYLADHLLDIGKSMILELLLGILNGDVVALPQDNLNATYDGLIDKASGVIDWDKPAVQIEREIRAFSGWPGSRATLANKEVTITKAKVLNEDAQPGNFIVRDKELIAYCGKAALLIERLKPAGKREMSAKEFLAGNKI